ncbi:ifrd domain protein [Colletotrichum truncatum]|uniref:Ifrd domain protein n=1 Tax=Colletotrichum truncatum TaxID=5467 RepID=A0ACC3ZE75_COLTU|nr:ifrd domain protein [Colletotrichum truncatum]KAF6801281.1 ifrd domain protein [Colletotrichum truncatum]
MHDLRLKVLRESGKTVSRKARSRPESARGSMRNSPNISPSHSQITSPAHSRAGSRYASEDEGSDDEYDDNMTMSTLSNGSDSGIDDAVGGAADASWATLLQDRIVELQDRKRTNTKGREATLMSYLHIVKHHYAGRQISGSLEEIVSALMKNIRSGGSSVERIYSLKSLQATLLTSPSDTLYDDIYPQLEKTCEDDEDNDVKAAAIWAMAIAALYGGGSEEAASEFLDYLVTVVDSDGEFIGAGDSGEVVTAALESWAFVASQIDDITENVYTAMDAFVEQLDSTDVDVQTSAGFNIAFIFEAARDLEEETDEPMNLQYDPKKLISRMAEASKPSVKQTSRKDRRHLRKQFASIVTSLEHGKGPGFSNAGRPAFNPHTGGTRADPGRRGDDDNDMHGFGYREKLRLGSSVVLINSWSLMARVDAARTVLGGGLPTHFNDNPTVAELLGGAETEDSAMQAYALHPRDAKKMRR